MDNINKTSNDGLLKVQCFINGTYVPIPNCKVVIVESNQSFTNLKKVFKGTTNQNGFINNIELAVPDISLSYQTKTLPYGIYNIGVSKAGYNNLIIKGVQVFPKVVSYQACPLTKAKGSPTTETITIAEHKHVTDSGSKVQGSIPKTDKYYCDPSVIDNMVNTAQKKKRGMRVLNSVVVPATITVHTGSPYDDSAPNYTLSFTDYIKNVACSELYSTWNSSALMANIYCIVSFALNRIFTEWYPSHGDNFDITNDTASVS